jgi:glycosyltransferase involved in cell wall biosynthesis
VDAAPPRCSFDQGEAVVTRPENFQESEASLLDDINARVRSPDRLDDSPDARLPRPPRVSVVIPTLNEAENLPHVFAEMPDDVYEVVLVDGRSTDGTVEVARRLYPSVRVVYQTSRGKGNALSCGFAACRGDIVVMADADGSTDLREIPRFLEALQSGADFAKGSRFLPGGGSADITKLRQAGNAVLVRLVNLLFRTNYSDLCYGFNAFWRYCLDSLDVDSEGFEVETQMNIRVSKAGLRVTEVPSVERERIHGVSNLHAVRDGWRVLETILRERLPEHKLQANVAGGAAATRFARRRRRVGTRAQHPRAVRAVRRERARVRRRDRTRVRVVEVL